MIIKDLAVLLVALQVVMVFIPYKTIFYLKKFKHKIKACNTNSYLPEQSGLVFSREADVLDMLESLNHKEKNA